MPSDLFSPTILRTGDLTLKDSGLSRLITLFDDILDKFSLASLFLSSSLQGKMI